MEVSVSTDDSDIDESKIPPREICEKRINEFVEISGTNEALAQFYLQDSEWDLQRSLDAYFMKDVSIRVTMDGENGNEGDNVEIRTTPRGDFSLVSWNVDGLSDRNLKLRVKAVCKIIEDAQVDIVFLQEVIPKTLKYFQEKLPKYFFIEGNENDEGADYFTVVCLRKYRIYVDKYEIIPYSRSVMGRNLIYIEAHIGKAHLALMNTHLESTKEHSSTRRQQLAECFNLIRDKISPDTTVIFGGDLNLRDSELHNVPENLRDLWVVNGSRKECQYTWDMTRNTNLQFPGKFKPRLRFDRLYMRQNLTREVRSKHFGLIGIQKINGTLSFPSDHWGILCHFKIDTSPF